MNLNNHKLWIVGELEDSTNGVKHIAIFNEDDLHTPICLVSNADDARLIASAPELLATLKRLVFAFYDYDPDATSYARNLIARIEGIKVSKFEEIHRQVDELERLFGKDAVDAALDEILKRKQIEAYLTK